MTLKTIGEIRKSPSLAGRITACAAQEGIETPDQWVASNMWKFATQPGWAGKWEAAYAAGTGVIDPGAGEAVITDGDILAAVQALNTGTQ